MNQCQCSYAHPDGGCHIHTCKREAVRMVTVYECECDNGHEQVGTVCRNCWDIGGRRKWNDPDNDEIPMCEVCADWHAPEEA